LTQHRELKGSLIDYQVFQPGGTASNIVTGSGVKGNLAKLSQKFLTPVDVEVSAAIRDLG